MKMDGISTGYNSDARKNKTNFFSQETKEEL